MKISTKRSSPNRYTETHSKTNRNLQPKTGGKTTEPIPLLLRTIRGKTPTKSHQANLPENSAKGFLTE
jgi:hypothetical protein